MNDDHVERDNKEVVAKMEDSMQQEQQLQQEQEQQQQQQVDYDDDNNNNVDNDDGDVFVDAAEFDNNNNNNENENVVTVEDHKDATCNPPNEISNSTCTTNSTATATTTMTSTTGSATTSSAKTPTNHLSSSSSSSSSNSNSSSLFCSYLRTGFETSISTLNAATTSSSTYTSTVVATTLQINQQQEQEQEQYYPSFLQEVEIHIVDPTSQSSSLLMIQPSPSPTAAMTTMTTTTTALDDPIIQSSLPPPPPPPPRSPTGGGAGAGAGGVHASTSGIYYNMFVQALEQESNSTINYIPIQLFRNNTKGVVEHLKIKPILNEHGGIIVNMMNDSLSTRSLMVSSSSSSSSALTTTATTTTTRKVSSTATNKNKEKDIGTESGRRSSSTSSSFGRKGGDWHTGPYCYIYFAACQNLEHYRTRVKPSIQAFVSQLESTPTPTTTTTTSATPATTTTKTATPTAVSGEVGDVAVPSSSTATSLPPPPPSRSPPYVIIFIPTGDDTAGGAGNTPGKSPLNASTSSNNNNSNNTNNNNNTASKLISGRYTAAAATLSSRLANSFGVSRRTATPSSTTASVSTPTTNLDTTATTAISGSSNNAGIVIANTSTISKEVQLTVNTTTTTTTTTPAAAAAAAATTTAGVETDPLTSTAARTAPIPLPGTASAIAASITAAAAATSHTKNSITGTITNSTNSTSTTATTTTTTTGTTITNNPLLFVSTGKNSITNTKQQQQQQQQPSVAAAPALFAQQHQQQQQQRLNRLERELFRRLTNDFPNGNVCTLSTLCSTTSTSVTTSTKTPRSSNDNDNANCNDNETNNIVTSVVTVDKVEWNIVMKAIGNAIGQGFLNRCHNCDDELRRFQNYNLQLMTSSTSSSSSSATTRTAGITTPSSSSTAMPLSASPMEQQQQQEGLNSSNSSLITASSGIPSTNRSNTAYQKGSMNNWNYFLLVKESLAFTYEQMHLYEEALLQYEEIRAFVALHNKFYNSLSSSSSSSSGGGATKSDQATVAIEGFIDDLESDLLKSKKGIHNNNNNTDLNIDGNNDDKRNSDEQVPIVLPPPYLSSQSYLTGNIYEFRSRLRSSYMGQSHIEEGVKHNNKKNQRSSTNTTPQTGTPRPTSLYNKHNNTKRSGQQSSSSIITPLPSTRWDPIGRMILVSVESDLVDEYIFGRELALLFRLKEPLRILGRCIEFVKNWYERKQNEFVQIMVQQQQKLQHYKGLQTTTTASSDPVSIPLFNILQQLQTMQIEMEKWAFTFCWDVQEASKVLIDINSSTKGTLTEASFDSKNNMDTSHSNRPQSSKVVASVGSTTNTNNIIDNKIRIQFTRKLCELMEFASRRLKRAGTLVLFPSISDSLTSSSQRQEQQEVSSSLYLLLTSSSVSSSSLSFEKEVTWKDGLVSTAPKLPAEGAQGDDSPDGLKSHSFNTDDIHKNTIGTTFIDRALGSETTFRFHYIHLLHTIVEQNELCNRYRYSARFRIEIMETYLAMTDTANAAEQLRCLIGMYWHERWDYSYFALLFQLASLERQIVMNSRTIVGDGDAGVGSLSMAAAARYLSTLVCAFSEKTYMSAPARALHALYDDIVSIVESSPPLVHGISFEDLAAPLFSPTFGLDRLSVLPPGYDRNLLKRVYTVGDTIGVTVSLTSFLPQQIVVDAVSVALVPFRTYVAAMEDNVPVNVGDAFRVLYIKSPVTIEPGLNWYIVEWKPQSSGQLIVSSTTIRWKGVTFTYSARAMKRRPTIRIDIVPSEPTQRLDVTPKFLIPGHEQPLNFSFSAGSDHVKSGVLQLLPTPGLLFLATDPFGNSSSSTYKSDTCTNQQVNNNDSLPNVESRKTTYADKVLSIITSGDNVDDDKNDEEKNSSDTKKKWVTFLNIPLQPCLPGQTVTISTRVKNAPMGRVVGDTGPDRVSDVLEPLTVKLSTSYKFADIEETKVLLPLGDPENSSTAAGVISTPTSSASSNYIDTTLETKVPTMNKHIVQVQEYDFVRYSLDRALVSVTIVSNAPVPFKVKGWSIQLPRPLLLVGDSRSVDGPCIGTSTKNQKEEEESDDCIDSDMNGSLKDSTIEYGEHIYLCFECVYSNCDIHSIESLLTSPSIYTIVTVDLENEYGTIFKEPLKLNLSRLMLQLGGTSRSIASPTLSPSHKRGGGGESGDYSKKHHQVSVTMVPSNTQGMVGVSVSFVATIEIPKSLYNDYDDVSTGPSNNNASSNSSSKVLSYKIVSIDDYWIVCGRIEGVLTMSEDSSSNNNSNKNINNTNIHPSRDPTTTGIHHHQHHRIEFVAIPTRPGNTIVYPTIRLMSREILPSPTAISLTTTTSEYTPIPVVVEIVPAVLEAKDQMDYCDDMKQDNDQQQKRKYYHAIAPTNHLSIAFPTATTSAVTLKER